MKTELQIAADKLINEIFGVKPGESVVLTADYESNENVLRAVAASVREAGAQVLIATVPPPRSVGKAADPDLPIEPLTAALSACDVWIEFNHQWLLYSTPFERASRENTKLRYMCLVDFDEDLMIRTIGHVETPQLQIFMRRVAELTRNAKTMRVTTPAGCDVSFEIDPVHYVACDCGDATTPAIHMLTGQINVVPRFGSINGTIVFDGSVTPPYGHAPSEPIRLIVKDGVIERIEGVEEAAEYGFNPGAKLTGNIVEDERVWGSTEWGIGYVSDIDAPPHGQDAVSHSDGICLNSTVWLDGVMIMDKGEIVLPELVEIMPKRA